MKKIIALVFLFIGVYPQTVLFAADDETKDWVIFSKRFPSPSDACDYAAALYTPTNNSRTYEVNGFSVNDGTLYDTLICHFNYTRTIDGTHGTASATGISVAKKYYLAAHDEDSSLKSCVGNPIDPATGNKYQQESLITLSGIHPVNLDLYFNSKRPEKWRHSYSRSVIRVSDWQRPIDTIYGMAFCGLNKQQESSGGFGRVKSITHSSSNNINYFPSSIQEKSSQTGRSTAEQACTENWEDVKSRYHYSWVSGSHSEYLENGLCGIYSENILRLTLNVFIEGSGFSADLGLNFECSDMDPTISPLLDSPNKINVRFTRQNGQLVRFTYNPETFQLENASNTGERAEFIVNVNGIDVDGYLFYTNKDEIEEYDDIGRLISITSLDGHTQTLTYIADSTTGVELLDQVQNDTGEFIDFNYQVVGEDTDNPYNRIHTIADHTGRSWEVLYDTNENPTIINMPDVPDGLLSRSYHYENETRTNFLTGITDERGNRYASWTYNADGKANSSAHGPAQDIELVTIDYHEGSNNKHAVTKVRKSGIEGIELPDIVSIYDTHSSGGSKVVANISGDFNDVQYEHSSVTGYLEYKIEHGVRTDYGNYDNKGNPGFSIEAANTTDARRTDYEYDPRFHSKVTTITEPSVFSGSNKVTTYTYDDYGNTTSIVISGFQPDGTAISQTTTLKYEGPYHQLTEIDGPRGDVNDIVTLQYYPNEVGQSYNRARLQSITGTDASTLLRSNIQYTSTGKVASEYRANGLSLTYTYNPNNDRLEHLDMSVATSSRSIYWTYLATGEVESITQGYNTVDSTTITLGYDPARRLNNITDDLGNSINYILDSEGNIEKEEYRDPANELTKTLTQTFDFYDRLDVFNQLNENSDYIFNNNGTLQQVTDGNDKVTTYDYDNLQRLTNITQDVNGIDASTANALTQYGYDSADRLTSVTDANSGETTYVYDDLGNLLSQNSPDTGLKTFTHDDAGNIRTQTDAKQRMFNYTYDAYNRLTNIDTLGSEDDVVYSYDNCENGYGKICSITRDPGSQLESKLQYRYNAFGEIKHVQQNLQTWSGYTQEAQSTYQLTYDSAGRIKTQTYPSGAVITYNYDVAGNISEATLDQQGSTTILTQNASYAPFGALTSQQMGNGVLHSASFDTVYRPQTSEAANVYSESIIDYDGNGNILASLTYNGNFNSQICSYDAHDRLDTSTDIMGDFDFDYDLVGNRTTEVKDSVSINMTYEPDSNRMDTLDGNNVTLDENGNTTRLRGMALTHSTDNRIRTISNKGKYRYNGIGQRIYKTDLTVPEALGDFALGQTFLYGLNGELIAEMSVTGKVLKEYIYMNSQPLAVIEHTMNTSAPVFNADYDEDGSISIQEYFLWYVRYYIANDVAGDLNNDGQIDGNDYTAAVVCVVTQNCLPDSISSEIYYVHNDHLGTPKALTNAAGDVVWNAVAEPFGLAVVNEDVDDDGELVEFNLRMSGQYYDVESGFYYNYFRYYDPETGRYITSDPIGLAGGVNTYAYVENNPLRYTDPYGLFVVNPVTINLARMGFQGALGLAAAWGIYNSSDYPVNPDDWNTPDGWTETPAGEKTGGKHRQWNGPDGKWRRWDREGRKGGKDRGSHWHDSDRPGEHIDPDQCE